MKKNNSKIENIKKAWKLFRSEKGKRYSFVLFYLFFFIFLFLFMTIDNTPKNTKKEIEEVEPSSFPFLTSNLENLEYEFSYIVDCGEKLNYQGKRRIDQITLEDENTVYSYSIKNGELIEDSDLGVVPYYDFSNIYFLKRVFKNSRLVSETKLTEEEKYVYTYKIKGEDLNLFLKEDIDTEESIILVTTNSLRKIEKIEIELTKDPICMIEVDINE